MTLSLSLSPPLQPPPHADFTHLWNFTGAETSFEAERDSLIGQKRRKKNWCRYTHTRWNWRDPRVTECSTGHTERRRRRPPKPPSSSPSSLCAQLCSTSFKLLFKSKRCGLSRSYDYTHHSHKFASWKPHPERERERERGGERAEKETLKFSLNNKRGGVRRLLFFSSFFRGVTQEPWNNQAE